MKFFFQKVGLNPPPKRQGGPWVRRSVSVTYLFLLMTDNIVIQLWIKRHNDGAYSRARTKSGSRDRIWLRPWEWVCADWSSPGTRASNGYVDFISLQTFPDGAATIVELYEYFSSSNPGKYTSNEQAESWKRALKSLISSVKTYFAKVSFKLSYFRELFAHQYKKNRLLG